MPLQHPVSGTRRRGRPAKGGSCARDSVLAAALHGFACKGYDGTGLREIAQAAGVDSALISYQFGSKIALWKAVVDEIAVRLAQARQAILDLHDAATPPEQRLREGMQHFIAVNCDIPEFAKFLADELSQPGERQDYILRHIWTPYQAAMMPLLEQAQAKGVLRQDRQLDTTLMMVMGAVMLPVMMLRRQGGHVSAQAELSQRLLADVMPMLLGR